MYASVSPDNKPEETYRTTLKLDRNSILVGSDLLKASSTKLAELFWVKALVAASKSLGPGGPPHWGPLGVIPLSTVHFA